MKEFVEMLYLIGEPVILSEDWENTKNFIFVAYRIRLYIWEIGVFGLNGKVGSLS